MAEIMLTLEWHMACLLLCVSFLGKVYNITAYEKAKHLGENAIRWILNHRISQSEKWLYPNRINLLSYDNKEASRLAWCYGDLGIDMHYVLLVRM